MSKEKISDIEKYINRIYELEFQLIMKDSRIDELELKVDLQKQAYANLEENSQFMIQHLVY